MKTKSTDPRNKLRQLLIQTAEVAFIAQVDPRNARGNDKLVQQQIADFRRGTSLGRDQTLEDAGLIHKIGDLE